MRLIQSKKLLQDHGSLGRCVELELVTDGGINRDRRSAGQRRESAREPENEEIETETHEAECEAL